MFATNVEPITLSTRDSIMTNYQTLKDQNNGGGTYANKAFEKILYEKIKFDRIIMLSDMQCYTSSWSEGLSKTFEEYKRKINPNVKLYSVNLCGYGTLQVPEDDKSVCLIDGWSDKILEYIPKFEMGLNTMLEDIENTIPSKSY
jgi:hypothetical protein